MISYNDWKNNKLIAKIREGIFDDPVTSDMTSMDSAGADVPAPVNLHASDNQDPTPDKMNSALPAKEFFSGMRFNPRLRGKLIDKKKRLETRGKQL